MDRRDLTTVILCGGLGTRLSGVLPGRPKALAPVAGRPFVTHLLDQLAAAGLREVVLLTGHLGHVMREELGETYGEMRLTHLREHAPLGTGGALREALPVVPAGTLLVLNGDSYLDLDIRSLRRLHNSRGAAVSLALAQVEDTSRYGRVELGAKDQVVAFREKAASAGPGWINAGVYMVARRVVESIPTGRPVSLEREVLPGRVTRGEAFGHRAGRRFLDIGTPESYAEAAHFFLTPLPGSLSHAAA